VAAIRFELMTSKVNRDVGLLLGVKKGIKKKKGAQFELPRS